MKKIIFVTSNHGKFEELSKALARFGATLEMKQFELPELQTDDIEKISMEKARVAYKAFKQTVLVEDTGVFFKAYNNFPGAYSKQMFKALGFDGFMKLLDGKDRGIYFKTVISLADKNGITQFEGVCDGTAPKKPIGQLDEKLPYDPIFMPIGAKKCFSQMSKEEKEKFSSRGAAAAKLGKYLSEQL